MVKLPMSDYVCNYYKEQGIEFTFRQQARFCWSYSHLLKDQIKSLKEILKISDDEKLNTEIKERLDYEEKAYECFMTNQHQGCFYIVYSDNKDEYDDEYFSAAENAVSYGTRHSDKEFCVEKRCLFDKAPKELSDKADGDDPENIDTVLSKYFFTSEGDVQYGYSYECMAPFEEHDAMRFENMFLNIKSPFGLGDIVMGPDFDYPRVVCTDHDCFEKLYERLKDHKYMQFDSSDNCICTDCIGTDGNPYYDHTIPFDLWKIDSWEDKNYWEILQILSKSAKAYVDIFTLDYYVREYRKHHCEE